MQVHTTYDRVVCAIFYQRCAVVCPAQLQLNTKAVWKSSTSTDGDLSATVLSETWKLASSALVSASPGNTSPVWQVSEYTNRKTNCDVRQYNTISSL